APAAARKIFRAWSGSAPESHGRLRACSWKESVFQLPQIPGCRGNRASLLPPDVESADFAQTAAAADPNSGASSADLHSAARYRVGTAADRRDSKCAARLE